MWVRKMEDKIEKVKPKDLTEKDEQKEFILKVLNKQAQEEEEDLDMNLHTRLVNRIKYLEDNCIIKGYNERKGEFWTSIEPILHISKFKPQINKELAYITFFVYEWDEKDHTKKKESTRYTDIVLADGSIKRIATDGTPVSKYFVTEKMFKNQERKIEVKNVLIHQEEKRKSVEDSLRKKLRRNF